MSVILSNLEYLTEEFRENPVAVHIAEALTDASSGARRGLRLIGNLLDLSRLEQQRFVLDRVPVDVGALMRDVSRHRRAQARAGQITIEVLVDPDLTVSADDDLLIRVIENIFDNALRYTPTGGRIALRGQRVGDRAQLRICNTGDTIPEEMRSRVFEKYSQGRTLAGRRMNMGLGLYFCRLAVEAHGGRIWTEIGGDFPTTFALELPL